MFKIVTVGGAFNEKLFSPLSVIDCGANGEFRYAGRILHDHKPMGDLTVQDVLAKSSNIGAAKIGINLGEQRLYEYIRKFGFGERTDVALPGEIAGEVHTPDRWSNLSITRFPMGQGVGVTPLAARRGHVRHRERRPSHDAADRPRSRGPAERRRHDCSTRSKSARFSARPPRTRCARPSREPCARAARRSARPSPGSPARARRAPPRRSGADKRYLRDKYVLSFVGMLPADDPQFVCLVMLDGPNVKTHEDNFGGMVAGPIFSRIAGKAACHMNLVPQFGPAHAGGPGQDALT